jgi:transglutaminase-like putative cysteine protease
VVENGRRREGRSGGLRRPGGTGRALDGPTSPTIPIVQRSEADTIRVPVLPAPRCPDDRAAPPTDPALVADRAVLGEPGPDDRGLEDVRTSGADEPGGERGVRARVRAARPPEPASRRATALTLVVALALVDGWGFGRLFDAADLWPLLPVAAVAPVLLVVVSSWGRRRGAPFALSALLWTIGFVLVAAAAVAAGAGGVAARLDVVRTGVLDGPTRLLDVAVPAPADADLLVVPFLVSWLAAALGAELVVRTRTRLLPAVPALVGLLAATAASVPGAGSNLAPVAALVAAVGLLVLVRRPAAAAGSAVSADGLGPAGLPGSGVSATGPGRAPTATQTSPGGPAPTRITLGPARPSRSLAAVRAAGALAIVVVAAVVAGTLLPGAFAAGGPVDPRAYRSTPANQVDGLNPLSALAGWTSRPDDKLFTVRLRGQSAGPVPLRLAVLSDFDGATWTSSAHYTRAGQNLPVDGNQPAPDGGPVTQELTVAALTGTLLPSLDRPVQVGAGTDTGLAVDLADGLLLRTAPVSAGDRFTVVSRPAPTRSVAQLAALTSGTAATAEQDAEYLALPANLPPVLRALARVAAGQGGGPFQQAALLQHYLATNFQFDPRVPPGHSLAHVEHFVADTRRGTSEQFAATFVLAARILGLPSRLVVGFAPGAPAGATTVTVTGRQALAWAEVRFDGAGWLPFFPTPSATDARGAALAGSTQGESEAQAALVDAAVRGPLAVAATVNRPAAAAAARPGRAGHLRGLMTWSGAGLGVLAVSDLAVALAGPLVRRRRRLSARRAPRERVVLAWDHVVDALLAVGVPIPASASPVEVVQLGARAVGGERADGRRAGAAGAGASMSALRGLANLATLALFGPDDEAGRPSGIAGGVLVAGATVMPVPGNAPPPLQRHGAAHAAGRAPLGPGAGRTGPLALPSGRTGPLSLPSNRTGPLSLPPGRTGPLPSAKGRTGPLAVPSGRGGPRALPSGRTGQLSVAGRRPGPLGLPAGRTGPLDLSREAGPTGPLALPGRRDGSEPPATTTTGGGEGVTGLRAADEARRLALTVEQAAWRSISRRRRLALRLSPRAVFTGRWPGPRG